MGQIHEIVPVRPVKKKPIFFINVFMKENKKLIFFLSVKDDIL